MGHDGAEGCANSRRRSAASLRLTSMERTLTSLNMCPLKVHMCFRAKKAACTVIPNSVKMRKKDTYGRKRRPGGGPTGSRASSAGAGLAEGGDQTSWPAGWPGCSIPETTQWLPRECLCLWLAAWPTSHGRCHRGDASASASGSMDRITIRRTAVSVLPGLAAANLLTHHNSSC